MTNLRALIEQFDTSLARCGLYGAAGRTREHWAALKALLSEAEVGASAPASLCVKCGKHPASICQGDYDIVESALIVALEELDRRTSCDCAASCVLHEKTCASQERLT